MTASITAAIRADAATSDAEGRAQAAEMVTALTIGALAETVTRLNASEDRALRLGVDLSNAVTARDAFAKSFSNALADLNATREKLTTAEAFRDSLQAEVDRAKSDASDMHESWMRKVDTVAGDRDRWRDIAKDNQQEAIAANRRADEVTAERDALRAEVDKLRARPVLTSGRLAAAILACRDLTPAGSAPGSMDHAAGILRYLGDGAVTLPAQDRAEELARAVNHGGGWPITTYAMSSALASLGAPATTPSKPAEDDSLPWGVARARDVPTEVRERGWQWHPIDSDTAFAPPFATIRACRHCGCLVAGGPNACGRCANTPEAGK